jgi:hypothetical protein
LDALALTFAEETQYGGYAGSDAPDVVFFSRPEPMMSKILGPVDNIFSFGGEISREICCKSVKKIYLCRVTGGVFSYH